MSGQFPRWEPEKDREGFGLLAAVLTVIATTSSFLVVAMLVTNEFVDPPIGHIPVLCHLA